LVCTWFTPGLHLAYTQTAKAEGRRGGWAFAALDGQWLQARRSRRAEPPQLAPLRRGRRHCAGCGGRRRLLDGHRRCTKRPGSPRCGGRLLTHADAHSPMRMGVRCGRIRHRSATVSSPGRSLCRVPTVSEREFTLWRIGSRPPRSPARPGGAPQLAVADGCSLNRTGSPCDESLSRRASAARRTGRGPAWRSMVR
jgi:hypothetical protein